MPKSFFWFYYKEILVPLEEWYFTWPKRKQNIILYHLSLEQLLNNIYWAIFYHFFHQNLVSYIHLTLWNIMTLILLFCAFYLLHSFLLFLCQICKVSDNLMLSSREKWTNFISYAQNNDLRDVSTIHFHSLSRFISLEHGLSTEFHGNEEQKIGIKIKIFIFTIQIGILFCRSSTHSGLTLSIS